MTDTETNTTEYSESAKALAKRQEKKAAIKKKKQEIAQKNFAGKRGRPKGAKNKLTLLREAVINKAEEMVLNDWEEVVNTTLELAKQGDTQCLKILWDRVIPSKRAIDENADRDKKPVVQINISGLQVRSVMGEDIEVTDADYEEVENDAD